MIVKTLVENKASSADFKSKHGICFYIETGNHKILFDLGKDRLFLENAKKMNVKIQDIDIVIISHGHSDHGGALKLFLENNNSAKIYIRENAFDKHYAKVLGFKINVGIDASLKNHPQVVLTGEKLVLDKELTLFSDVKGREAISELNKELFVKIDKNIVKDNFSHEQSLIISENKKLILVTGCSHAGVVNIKNKAETIINNKMTDVIGGFHLYNAISKKTVNDDLIEEVAKKLNNEFTNYYTCHCTGEKAFVHMKKILSNNLNYLSTGSEIEI